jgi:hypothetical protein
MNERRKHRILVACEESQVVTVAFRERGFEAYSCDIQDCSGGHPEWHIKGDVLEILDDGWDLLIAHPPCTYLSNAGVGWFNVKKYGDKAIKRIELREEAKNFFMEFVNANVLHVCIENPVGWINTSWRKADQIIEPFMFGDPEKKRTCLWLKNLPLLRETNRVEPIVHGRYNTGKRKGKRIYFNDSLGRSMDRAKLRSKTFPGIAEAMAKQWGDYLLGEKYFQGTFF